MSRFSTRQLGKTGLNVSPLGIGGGNGIQSEDLLYAFERGINYFFYSSDLHHFRYNQSTAALKKLCARNSSVREKVVLATVSYLNDPEKLLGVVLDQFFELGIDYIDVFHWGWITEKHDVVELLNAAQSLKQEGELTRLFRQLGDMSNQAAQVNEELLKRGLVRNVGMSFHSRRAALKAINNIDVMMLRYSIANTDIEQTVFPHLSGNKDVDPGIVVFSTAHTGTSYFHLPPPRYPSGLYVPSVADCYRFALSNPWVNVVLTGVANRQEIDQALEAIENGPLDAEDYEFLREYGSLFAERSA